MLERTENKGSTHNCHCCGLVTNNSTYRYHYSDFETFIYRCNSCTFEFMRPLPLADVTNRKMESIDDAEMFNSSLLKKLHERLIIQPEIRRARDILGRKDFSMLDVGCGTGWISKIWADSGALVTGLEPSETRAEIARKRSLRVLSCYAEELATDEHFDLIVIRHVIEHLEKPADILRTLATRLTPGGLLLVVVPNIDCIGQKVFNTDWTWVLPWHCNFFNPHSLRKLLDASGYTICRMYQTPSPLWYPESFRRRFPRLGKLIGSGLLDMLLFAPLVGAGYLSGYSDNITVFARPQN